MKRWARRTAIVLSADKMQRRSLSLRKVILWDEKLRFIEVAIGELDDR